MTSLYEHNEYHLSLRNGGKERHSNNVGCQVHISRDAKLAVISLRFTGSIAEFSTNIQGAKSLISDLQLAISELEKNSIGSGFVDVGTEFIDVGIENSLTLDSGE